MKPRRMIPTSVGAAVLLPIKILAAKTRVKLPTKIAINAEVDLGITHGARGLTVRTAEAHL